MKKSEKLLLPALNNYWHKPTIVLKKDHLVWLTHTHTVNTLLFPLKIVQGFIFICTYIHVHICIYMHMFMRVYMLLYKLTSHF